MRFPLSIILGTVLAAAALADTVHFKDGTSINGVVSEQTNDNVVLKVGSGTVTFPAAEVASIEKNDKEGNALNVGDLRAQQHEAALDKRTGMSEEQRDGVREALQPLWSPDEAVRNDTRKKLVKMSGTAPVFQYIEAALPYSKGLVVPEMLQTLVDVDPKKARDVVTQYTGNKDPSVRGKALQLLAVCGGPDDVETVACGLVDIDPAVRLCAAHAIGEAGVKPATGALIKGLGSGDQRQRNVCEAALRQIWQGVPQSANLKTPEQWGQFWSDHKKGITDIIDESSLGPLVSKEDLDTASKNHDE